ncbi:MAG: fused acetyl/propionyl-CoA carboxylase subunit alpha/methylmalonyl-CoA decarboxylase subunit alpha, partial [Sciscionella sp.]
SPELGPALYRMFLAHRRAGAHVPVISELLQWRLRRPESLPEHAREDYREVLDHLVSATQLRHPVIGDLARQVRYRCFDARLIAEERAQGRRQVRIELDRLSADPDRRAAQIDAIVASGEPILGVFAERHHAVMLEVMTRRYYRIRPLGRVRVAEHGGRPRLTAEYRQDGHEYLLVATVAPAAGADGTAAVATDLHQLVATLPADRAALIDLYVTSETDRDGDADPEARAGRIRGKLGRIPESVRRVSVAVRRPDGEESGGPSWFTFRGDSGAGGAPVEQRTLRGLHPMVAERLGLWRLSGFELNRLPSATDVHLFRVQGREVPDDQRLIAMADVRELTIRRDEDGRIRGLPQLEHMLDACLDSLRAARSADPDAAKLEWNRVLLYIWPVVDVPLGELDEVVRTLAPRTESLGLEQVLVQFHTAGAGDGEPRELMLRMSRPPGAGLTLRITAPPSHSLREMDAYTQKVIRARRRGAVYPYELIPMLTRSPDHGGDAGTFTEYDLDEAGASAPVDRAPGANTANFVLGVVSTPTERYPEGIRRVVLLGDPTKALGAIAEPECRRVLAAIELARRLQAPIEWFAMSAGAKIAMDSGTENMDWISRVLRGLIEFTQDGGEINVVVTGINVGAQPYWNAEATMLMHTKGILVMTPDSTMVLT